MTQFSERTVNTAKAIARLYFDAHPNLKGTVIAGGVIETRDQYAEWMCGAFFRDAERQIETEDRAEQSGKPDAH